LRAKVALPGRLAEGRHGETATWSARCSELQPIYTHLTCCPGLLHAAMPCPWLSVGGARMRVAKVVRGSPGRLDGPSYYVSPLRNHNCRDTYGRLETSLLIGRNLTMRFLEFERISKCGVTMMVRYDRRRPKKSTSAFAVILPSPVTNLRLG
jgi:hypothetical protein